VVCSYLRSIFGHTLGELLKKISEEFEISAEEFFSIGYFGSVVGGSVFKKALL